MGFEEIFKSFSETLVQKEIIQYFEQLLESVGETKESISTKGLLPYEVLKSHSRANDLWDILDKKKSLYGSQHNCGSGNGYKKVVICGGGIAGLRTSIELRFLNIPVTILEKRTYISRHNILHLWWTTIDDLKSIGLKFFCKKFCSGGYNHISTRSLQASLFKISLLVGVDIIVGAYLFDVSKPKGLGNLWTGHAYLYENSNSNSNSEAKKNIENDNLTTNSLNTIPEEDQASTESSSLMDLESIKSNFPISSYSQELSPRRQHPILVHKAYSVDTGLAELSSSSESDLDLGFDQDEREDNKIKTPENTQTNIQPNGQNKKKSKPKTIITVDFNVLIGAEGENSFVATKFNFEKKYSRGGEAIAITANFVNKKTREEQITKEVNYTYYLMQDYFKDLKEKTGVKLENLVYYRGDTHYFVMTIKRESLLSSQIVFENYKPVAELLKKDNINRNNLHQFLKKLAEYCGLSYENLEFASNHYGAPDAQIFDFTTKHQCQDAAKIIFPDQYPLEISQSSTQLQDSTTISQQQPLLICLAGDALVAPFWPQGTGANRAIQSALDTTWLISEFHVDYKPQENSNSNSISEEPSKTPAQLVESRNQYFLVMRSATPSIIRKGVLDPSTRYHKTKGVYR